MPEADLRDPPHRALEVLWQSFAVEPSHKRIQGLRQAGQTRTDRHLPPVFYRFSQLNLKETAPDGDRHGMGPVVGMQLLDDILDVEINCRLRNPQSIGNLLVAIALLNQSQHFEFPTCKVFFAEMLGEASRRFRCNLLLPGMDRADRVEQLSFRGALEKITRSSRP